MSRGVIYTYYRINRRKHDQARNQHLLISGHQPRYLCLRHSVYLPANVKKKKSQAMRADKRRNLQKLLSQSWSRLDTALTRSCLLLAKRPPPFAAPDASHYQSMATASRASIVDCLIADRTDGVSSERYPIVDTVRRNCGVRNGPFILAAAAGAPISVRTRGTVLTSTGTTFGSCNSSLFFLEYGFFEE
jgi:hypothetical protein